MFKAGSSIFHGTYTHYKIYPTHLEFLIKKRRILSRASLRLYFRQFRNIPLVMKCVLIIYGIV